MTEGKRSPTSLQLRAPCAPGRGIYREPTWCSSLGRGAAGLRCLREFAPGSQQPRLGCSSGGLRVQRRRGRLSARDHVSRRLGPIAGPRARRRDQPALSWGASPRPGRDGGNAGLAGLWGRSENPGQLVWVALTGAPGEAPWRQHRSASSGCRPGGNAANLPQAGRQHSGAAGKEMPFTSRGFCIQLIWAQNVVACSKCVCVDIDRYRYRWYRNTEIDFKHIYLKCLSCSLLGVSAQVLPFLALSKQKLALYFGVRVNPQMHHTVDCFSN